MSAPQTTPTPQAASPRLTGLSPEEVLALPPEQRELWRRQSEEEGADFHFLMTFADDLYPPLRKYFKRSRAGQLFDDFSKSADVPLFEVFDALISLGRIFEDEPGLLDRLARNLPRRQRAALAQQARKKAEKKAQVEAKGAQA